MTDFDLASLDMAGTTIDERGLVYEVLDRTVSELTGTAVPAELLRRWKGTSKREAVHGLLSGLGAPAGEDDVDKTFEEFTVRLVAAYRATPPVPIAGVPEALSALRHSGVKVALQTGYSAAIAEAILDGLGWQVGPSPDDTVDALVTSDQVPSSRPAPYLVFRTMEATGVHDVNRVLVAGDTPNDLLAGTNSGARFVVGVLSGSFDAAGLGPHRHTHLLPSLATVNELVGTT